MEKCDCYKIFTKTYVDNKSSSLVIPEDSVNYRTNLSNRIDLKRVYISIFPYAYKDSYGCLMLPRQTFSVAFSFYTRYSTDIKTFESNYSCKECNKFLYTREDLLNIKDLNQFSIHYIEDIDRYFKSILVNYNGIFHW